MLRNASRLVMSVSRPRCSCVIVAISRGRCALGDARGSVRDRDRRAGTKRISRSSSTRVRSARTPGTRSSRSCGAGSTSTARVAQEIYALPNLTYDEVDRILAYREEAGRIGDPTALVGAGALTEERLLQIAPFLVVGGQFDSLGATNGRVRFVAVGAPTDGRAPSMSLQARVSTLRHLTVGVSMLATRLRVGDVRYDPGRDALSATPATTRFRVPKFFAEWQNDHVQLVLGTFRAGFGQRLTFDNSDRFTPNGIYLDDAIFWSPGTSTRCRESTGELTDSPCAGAAGSEYVTSDLRWRNGLTGIGIGIPHIKLGESWLQLYAWGSYQTQSIYQYEIYDRGRCDDPRADTDECSSPDVFRRRDDPLEPTSRFSFQTLDDLYAEVLGGANATLFFNRRAHIGVTGYAAHARWLTEGIDLDFQEWASRPFGGGVYGAVGVDAAIGFGIWDGFLEIAHTFDDMEGGGGGLGLILRNTLTWNRNELELVARYYDEDFANPFGRPIAGPDEVDGNRARDEVGGRIRFTGTPVEGLNLRASADFWSQRSDGQPKLLVFVRADYQLGEVVRPGLWVQYQNRDLSESGTRQDVCFSVSTENDENGEPVPCSGEQIHVTGRLQLQLGRRASIMAQYRHEWLDDGSSIFDDSMRQDVSAFVSVRANPIDPLRIVFRTRFLFEDIENRDRMEQSIWAYLSLSYRFPNRLTLSVRYDVQHYLDTRAATDLRSPNPEHWGRLELQQRF